MSNLLKFISISVCLAVIATACAPAAVPTTPEVIVETVVVKETVVVPGTAIPIEPATAPAISNPIVIAVPVSTLPVIDADASDEQWKDAPVSQVGGMQWKAVYTDKDLALLIKWIDRDLTMNANGNYLWDPATSSWSQIAGKQEWMNLAWGINTVVGEEGCQAFCHEDPPGSGLFHHQTATIGEYADSWMLFGKHGWSFQYVKGIGGVQSEEAYGFKKGQEDLGWIMGNIASKQNSPLVFETTNANDPRNIVAGDVTFVDYAEDNIITAKGDPLDAARDRPRDAYCQDCHNQIALPYDPLEYDLTKPDDGEIKYSGNYVIPYTAPAYMEKDPTDFVDAMVLTQAEVDSGEAVAVAGLTPAQISQYWAKYAAVNGVVPPLVLKTASGSMADVLVGSNWKNGVWTMEITRKLVTPYGGDDVQFDDFTKDYHFSLTITNSGLLLGPQLNKYGGFLKFQH